MEEDSGICLNLGAGKKRWPGWVNVDFEGDHPCDIRHLDFPDDYADTAAAIHVLEHFYEWEALDVLKEWHRVLKPGGKLILELPCLDKVFSYMAHCMVHKVPMVPAFSMFAFWGDPQYKSVAMCHKWGYTKQSLKNLVAAAGFRDAEVMDAVYHFPERDMRLVAYK